MSYLVEENVLESDLSKIRQGIELGSKFVAAQLGGVEGYVCVDVRVAEERNGSGGTYFGDRVVMFTGVSGWRGPRSLPWHLAKVTALEYAHVWQRDFNRGPIVGPRWLHEGSAELIGVRSLLDAGVVREAEAQSFLRSKVTNRDLRDFEPAAMGGFDYSLGYFAVEFLIRGSGFASLRNYLMATSRGSGWEAAFLSAFGVDVPTFYERFDRHRTAGFPS